MPDDGSCGLDAFSSPTSEVLVNGISSASYDGSFRHDLASPGVGAKRFSDGVELADLSKVTPSTSGREVRGPLLETVGGASASRRSSRTMERKTSEPAEICGVLVAGRSIEAWNEQLFRSLRVKHGVRSDFLAGLNLANIMEKASKSREPLWISADEEFIIKAMGVGDHRSMLEHTSDYHTRLTAGSILVPIYLHFRFLVDSPGKQDSATQWKSYIAMRNVTPGSPWRKRYDLKGCDDDKTLETDGARIRAVHRRWWSFCWYFKCCWSADRWSYWNGKQHARQVRLQLPKALRDTFLKYLEGDVDWLNRCGLMDYSLLVGIKRFPASVLEDSSEDAFSELADWCRGRQAFVYRDLEVQRRVVIDVLRQSDTEGTGLERRLEECLSKQGLDLAEWEWSPLPPLGNGAAAFPCKVVLELLKKTRDRPVVLITVGIVDFLQTWTCKKKMASCLKLLEKRRATVPPDLYAQRFVDHFRDRVLEAANTQQVTGCKTMSFHR